MADPVRKGKKATSYDVARDAGVSQATVSLVLSGKGDRLGISAETAGRVREAAHRLSYYPNSLVRSIRRGATGIVGVYGRDRGWGRHNSYWTEALSALHAGAADLDRELLIYSDHPNRTLDQALERMLNGILDGMIVQPSEHNEVVEALARSPLPLVAIGDPFPGVPSVTIDNVGGIEAVVAHLAARGRRAATFLNFAAVPPTFGAPYVREQAFLKAAEAAGILAPVGAARLETDLSEIVPQLMESGTDAIVVINDEWAYHVLSICAAQGVRVPEDVAVTGFDGIPVPHAPKRLTTLRSPIEAMCRTALDGLNALICGDPVEPLVTLPVELEIGETT